MPRLLFVAIAAIVALSGLLLGAVVVSGFGGDSTGKGRQLPPPSPQNVSVSFDFQDGPSLVFVCWSHDETDVNFYDVLVRGFNAGKPTDDVRYGVTTTSCAGALGTGEYMWKPDLYHYAVRACNNAGCSAWADATGPDDYWHSVPCTDPSGRRCQRPF